MARKTRRLEMSWPNQLSRLDMSDLNLLTMTFLELGHNSSHLPNDHSEVFVPKG